MTATDPVRSDLDPANALGAAGTGTTLVLLHGAGLDGSFWAPVRAVLAERYRVLTPDLPGHGASAPLAAGFSIGDLADGVAAVLRTELTDPAIVVGCSMGGMVAQALALAAPELVAALVLANTRCDFDDAGRAALERRAAAAEQADDLYYDETMSRWFSDDFRRRQPEIVAATRAALASTDPQIQAADWRAIASLSLRASLAQCAMPALVVSGTADTSCPPAAGRELQQALGNARYVEIEGAGHLLPVEQPEIFARLVMDFVEGPAPAVTSYGRSA